jgi:hypothetical protein
MDERLTPALGAVGNGTLPGRVWGGGGPLPGVQMQPDVPKCCRTSAWQEFDIAHLLALPDLKKRFCGRRSRRVLVFGNARV